MKPAAEAFSRTSTLLIALAALLILGLFGSRAADRLPDGAQHLVQAEWLVRQVQAAPGYEPAPQRVDSAALEAPWTRIELPLALPISLLAQARAHEGLSPTQTTWLRLRPEPPAGSAQAPAEALALYGSRIKADGTVAVYVDGELVHQAQVRGPLWNSTRTPLWIPLDRPPGAPPVKEILLRLQHSARTQVAVGSLWLGPADVLLGRYHTRQWLQQELPSMLSAAFMAVGVFAFLVWLRRPQETRYLMFFVLATASFIRGLHFYVSFPVANDWFAWLTVNALFWLIAVVHVFLRQLHGRPLTGFTRALVGLTALVAVMTLPVMAVWPNTPKVTPLIYVAAAAMGAAVGLVGGACAWRRSHDGMLVAMGIGVCTLLGVSDWLLQNNFVSPEGWYLGAYSNAITFGIFGTLMYRRYVRAISEVEELNASLALRLAAREAELERSHQQLREVQIRQTISDERQRLMQDMHDGLGASLIGAIRSVERGGISDTKVSQILKSCLDDLKLAIDSMEPVEADLLLLLATLRFRLEPRLEDAGVALLWNVRELPSLPWLDPSSALHILRVLQESIANILRHTQATEIRVATAPAGDGVEISIEDNGQGFDVRQARAQAKGRGLHNQERRAQSIDGRVHWQSGPAGTRFMLWLPLRRPRSEHAARHP